ncbi:hypothetical protein V8C37DRAFT_365573 [Trichoderma ceciliae]
MTMIHPPLCFSSLPSTSSPPFSTNNNNDNKTVTITSLRSFITQAPPGHRGEQQPVLKRQVSEWPGQTRDRGFPGLTALLPAAVPVRLEG